MNEKDAVLARARPYEAYRPRAAGKNFTFAKVEGQAAAKKGGGLRVASADQDARGSRARHNGGSVAAGNLTARRS